MCCKTSVFRVAVLALAGLLGASIPALAGPPAGVDDNRLEFRLSDLDGNPVASDDPRFVGKVLLVDLWGTWCPPCVSMIPTFIDLERRKRVEGLVIVAIAFEEEEADVARRELLRDFVKKRGINYIVLDGGPVADFHEALPGVRNLKGFPFEIVVDRGGRVVHARNTRGYKKKWARKLEEELDRLLSSRY